MLLENKKIIVDGAKIEALADIILQVVGNNALNVLFAIEELKAKDYQYEELVDALTKRKLYCEISKYAWINENIESKKKRGTNQLGFLANSNHKIATKFSDAKIRDELLKKYPCDEVKQDVPVYSSAINKAQESTELAIMDTVRKQGLSVQAIELLDTYTKQDYSSTYRFLIKVGNIINDVDKGKFVQNVVVPYVIVANRYGLHGSGLCYSNSNAGTDNNT